MKKIAAGAFDALHLLATAIVFTAAFWLAPLTQRVRGFQTSPLTDETPKSAEAAQQFLLTRGPWIAALALLLAGIAGFLRGDSKRMMPLVRLVASGVALLASLWAAFDLPAHRLPHAWNGIFVSCALVLVLTGFLVSPGKGGGSGSKSAASSK